MIKCLIYKNLNPSHVIINAVGKESIKEIIAGSDKSAEEKLLLQASNTSILKTVVKNIVLFLRKVLKFSKI